MARTKRVPFHPVDPFPWFGGKRVHNAFQNDSGSPRFLPSDLQSHVGALQKQAKIHHTGPLLIAVRQFGHWNPNHIAANVMYTWMMGSMNDVANSGRPISGISKSQMKPPAAAPAGRGTNFRIRTSSMSFESEDVMERNTLLRIVRMIRSITKPKAITMITAPHLQYSMPMSSSLNQGIESDSIQLVIALFVVVEAMNKIC